MLRITPTLAIDEARISEAFVRASGPGGQNVNKVSTAVELRFDAAGLPQPLLARLRSLAGRRMAAGDVLVIMSDRFRSQVRNREDARERLLALLREAAQPPRKRIATRMPLGAKKRRMEGKKHRAGIKSLRQSKPGRED